MHDTYEGNSNPVHQNVQGSIDIHLKRVRLTIIFYCCQDNFAILPAFFLSDPLDFEKPFEARRSSPGHVTKRCVTEDNVSGNSLVACNGGPQFSQDLKQAPVNTFPRIFSDFGDFGRFLGGF